MTYSYTPEDFTNGRLATSPDMISLFAVPPEARRDVPSWFQVINSAFELHSLPHSFFMRMKRGPSPTFKAEEGYHALDRVDNERGWSRENPFLHLAGYEDYLNSFLRSRSPEETEAIKFRIDKEIQHRRILELGGARAVFASILAGGIDPLIVVPPIKAIRGIRFGMKMIRPLAQSSAQSAGLIALQEAGIHAVSGQHTRTFQESAISVGLGTLMSGALVGAGVGLKSLPWARLRELRKILPIIEEDGNRLAVLQDGSVDPMAPARDPDAVKLKTYPKGADSAEEAASYWESHVKANTPGVTKTRILKAIRGRFIGMVNLQTSPYKSVRRITRNFMRTMGLVEGDVAPIHDPLQTTRDQSRYTAAAVVDRRHTRYVQYVTGDPEAKLGRVRRFMGTKPRADQLSMEDATKLEVLMLSLDPKFHDKVDAIRDAPDFVKQNYKDVRAALDEMIDDAVEKGVVDPKDRVPHGYLMIWPDRQKAMAQGQRELFVDIISKWKNGQDVSSHARGPISAPKAPFDDIDKAVEYADFIYKAMFANMKPEGVGATMLARPMRQRTQDIPRLLLEPWLTNDLDKIIRHYIPAMAVETNIQYRDTLIPLRRALTPANARIKAGFERIMSPGPAAAIGPEPPPGGGQVSPFAGSRPPAEPPVRLRSIPPKAREAPKARPEPVPPPPVKETPDELRGMSVLQLKALAKDHEIVLKGTGNKKPRIIERLKNPIAREQVVTLPRDFNIKTVKARLENLAGNPDYQDFSVATVIDAAMQDLSDGGMALGSGSSHGFAAKMPETISEHFKHGKVKGSTLIAQYSNVKGGLGDELLEKLEARYPGMGSDYYIAMMEHDARSTAHQAMLLAKQLGPHHDPELSFMAYLYERLLPSGSEARQSQAVVKFSDMELGDTFTIHGDEFSVVRLGRDGLAIRNLSSDEFPIGLGVVEKVPVDQGSYNVAGGDVDPSPFVPSFVPKPAPKPVAPAVAPAAPAAPARVSRVAGDTVKGPTMAQVRREFAAKLESLHNDLVDEFAPPEGLGGAKYRESVEYEFRAEKLEEWHRLDEGDLDDAINSARQNLEDRWGGGDSTLLIDEMGTEMQADINAAMDVGDSGLVTKLENARNRTLGFFEDSRDHVRGQYGLPTHPGAVFPRVLSVLRDWNYNVLGGWIPWSSLSDFGLTIMQSGVRRAFGSAAMGWRKNMGDIQAQLSTRDAERLMIATDEVINSRNRDLFSLGQDFEPENVTKFETFSHRSTDVVSALVGTTWYNQTGKTIVGRSTINMVMENADSLIKTGRFLDPEDEIRLTKLYGVSRDDLIGIGRQWYEHAHVVGGVKSHWAPNVNAWTDKAAFKAVQDAVWNAQKLAILTGSPLDLPKIAPTLRRGAVEADAEGAVVGDRTRASGSTQARANLDAVQASMFQFQNFNFSAHTRVTGLAMQIHDQRYLLGIMASISLGMFSIAMKNALARREMPGIDDWIAQGIDQSGVLGIMFDVTRPLEQLSQGRFGVGPLLGKAGIQLRGPRYYDAPMAYEAVFGSSFGIVGGALGVVGSILGGEWDKSDKRNLERLIPGWNAWQIVTLMNWLIKPALASENNE